MKINLYLYFMQNPSFTCINAITRSAFHLSFYYYIYFYCAKYTTYTAYTHFILEDRMCFIIYHQFLKLVFKTCVYTLCNMNIICETFYVVYNVYA